LSLTLCISAGCANMFGDIFDGISLDSSHSVIKSEG
jgi:hypothetical protein